MPPKSDKTKAAETALAQWQSKVTYYSPEGWTPSVPVNVLSARTKGKKGLAFVYGRHVHNNVTGSEWIDVYDKQDTLWSFPPECVTIKVVRPKRKYTRKANAT